MANKWPSHFHHPQKWTIDLLFKITESENTWKILRNPLPTHLLCRYHKCMFPFWFFKVWSVTCLNANEILVWILWKFSQVICCPGIKETKEAYISNYISYFLNNTFGKFMSVTIICVCYLWQDFVFEMYLMEIEN